MSDAIPLARYRFTCTLDEPARLPEFAGPALRGAFGHALRQLSCMTKAKECTGCMLLTGCPFPALFAPHELPKPTGLFTSTIQHIPVPYVIEPPLNGKRTLQAGDTLAFNIVLMGTAVAQLPLIILAWQRALARGLTSRKSKATLHTVELLPPAGEPQLVYNQENPHVIPHTAQLSLPLYSSTQDMHLHLQTAVRIEKQKQALGPAQISAPHFLRHLIRRISLLAHLYFPEEKTFLPDQTEIAALNTLADNVQDDRRLNWQEWKRYSTRQDQEIILGGVQGHWLMKQVPPPLLPYLYLGQWLHAGKETAFGLGQYEITTTAWQPSRDTKP